LVILEARRESTKMGDDILEYSTDSRFESGFLCIIVTTKLNFASYNKNRVTLCLKEVDVNFNPSKTIVVREAFLVRIPSIPTLMRKNWSERWFTDLTVITFMHTSSRKQFLMDKSSVSELGSINLTTISGRIQDLCQAQVSLLLSYKKDGSTKIYIYRSTLMQGSSGNLCCTIEESGVRLRQSVPEGECYATMKLHGIQSHSTTGFEREVELWLHCDCSTLTSSRTLSICLLRCISISTFTRASNYELETSNTNCKSHMKITLYIVL
jgi:hypothetical protein